MRVRTKLLMLFIFFCGVWKLFYFLFSQIRTSYKIEAHLGAVFTNTVNIWLWRKAFMQQGL